MYRWLIEMVIVATDKTYPVVVCETEERADKWIEDELEDKEYNGTGYFRKTKIPYYF